jgi:hypothetical protein
MISPYIIKLLLSEPFTENPFNQNGWEQFYKEIEVEGLAPAFHSHLQDAPFVPEIVKNQARKKYEDALIFKDYCRCKLAELQPALSSTGRVVITKGLALCEKVYQEPDIRPMGDVDLYLPDGSLNQVKTILIKNGFCAYNNYNNVFFQKELYIDLHEDLWDSKRIPARKRIVSGLKESFIPSSNIPGYFIPSHELLALHTAYHCLKHGFSRKIWHLDLLLLYKAGYFNTVISAGESPFALFALEYLSHQGLLEGKGIINKGMSNFRKSMLTSILDSKIKTGMGEIALALSGPSLIESIRYLFSSLFPGKEILKEMYGSHPYLMLLGRRIFEIAGYIIGALLCKRK